MTDGPVTPAGRAALLYGVLGREIVDTILGLIVDLDNARTPAERIRATRIPRVQTIHFLDMIVLREVLAGASWDEIADGLGLPADEVERRYAPTAAMWELGETLPASGPASLELAPGTRADEDPVGTAAALGAWLARHAEPWDAPTGPDDPGPVARALTR